MIARLKRETEELHSRLSPEAQKLLGTDINPSIDKQEQPPLLADLFAIDYRETPIGIRQFITEPFFLGQSLRDSLFPKIIDDLEELFEGEFSEVLLAGGIGWGKTRMAEVGLLYDLYRLSCLRNPAQSFGLIPGSTLALLNVSIKKEQAQKVMFAGLFEIIRRSPYFRKVFPYEPNRTTEIRFPNSITCYPVASNETSMLGEGVFSAAFDEMNFMPVVAASKSAPEGGIYDAAQSLYTRLSRRMLSRFQQKGRLPGHLWLISSPRYPNDFTERKEWEIRDGKSKHIFFRRYSMWETRDRAIFLPENFQVEIGNTTKRTRILDGKETDVDQNRVLTVPIDFRPEFERDPDEAARDLGGRSVLTIHPFIGRRDLVQKMFDNGTAAGLRHPYSKLNVTLQDDDSEYLMPENLHFVKEPRDGKVTTKLFPGPYFAHVDLAKNHDACGVAIGHIVGMKDVQRGVGPERQFERRPVIRVDLVLRVVAPPLGEILAASVRSIFYRFGELGANFGLITYDTWGSHESIQLLNSQGYTADNYSLDKTEMGYETLKTAIYDERVLCYPVPVLLVELTSLIQHEKTGKVDHTPNGSKDLADALAGMVQHCDDYVSMGMDTRSLAPSKGRVDTKGALMERVMSGQRITEAEFDSL